VRGSAWPVSLDPSDTAPGRGPDADAALAAADAARLAGGAPAVGAAGPAPPPPPPRAGAAPPAQPAPPQPAPPQPVQPRPQPQAPGWLAGVNLSVAGLLGPLGLLEFEPLLSANAVDMAALQLLSREDLRELGLPLGAVVKLQAALRGGPQQPPQQPPRGPAPAGA
jgi:hypothetical protein